MKKYKEINWSEVVRRSIEEYIRKLEETRTVADANELLDELKSLGISPEELEPLNYDEEMKHYKELGEREWKRLFMIQAK